MTPLLVLGLGSRLMGDDAIGVAIVEALAGDRPPGESGPHYAVGETDFAYCLNLALEAEFLILVDAVETGATPGEVVVIPLAEITPGAAGISLHDTHFLDLLLQVAPHKGGVLIGIEPARVEFRLGLSPELDSRFGAILERVRGAIGQATTGLA